MNPFDHWKDRHDRGWGTTVEVGTVHPLGRFLAAVAEAGFPAIVPARYARHDVAVIEWPDDAPCPADTILRARELSGADVDADAFDLGGEVLKVRSAICVDPWPDADRADFPLRYPELSR